MKLLKQRNMNRYDIVESIVPTTVGYPSRPVMLQLRRISIVLKDVFQTSLCCVLIKSAFTILARVVIQ